MFTFDVFSFIQVAFLFFLFLGITGVLHREEADAQAGRESAVAPIGIG